MGLGLAGEFQLGQCGQHEALRGVHRTDDFVVADGCGRQCLAHRAEKGGSTSAFRVLKGSAKGSLKVG